MDPQANSIIEIYTRHAAAFDQGRSRALFEQPWLDRFRAAMPPRPRVLDLGCGSGEPIARYLVEHGCNVTGVDASKPLLGLAAARLPQHRWVYADMRSLRLGERFHGIIAWDSFFHLSASEQRRMFPIFADHAEVGAALMFTSGTEAGARVGEFQGEPLYHASLDEQEYQHLLADHRFEVLEHAREDPGCAGHTIWLARAVSGGR